MVRLLRKPIKPTASKSERVGRALSKLKLVGHATIPQAAQILGVHPITLRDHAKADVPGCFRLGHRIVLSASLIEHLQLLMAQHGNLARSIKVLKDQAAPPSEESSGHD